VIKAIEKARELGMKVVTLSGLKPENQSRKLGDINLYVPAKTYGVVECAHQILLHAWLDCSMGVTEWEREGVQNMHADEFTL
jgi:D-sedoheptulose 7-phosphate isomerase